MINVLEMLERSAQAYPDAVAFSDPGKSVTFAQLQKRARQIGTIFLGEDAGDMSAVAFFMEKSVDALSVMFGAVHANCFYSFIDVRQPGERARQMLDTLSPAYIVTNKENKAVLLEDILSKSPLADKVILIDDLVKKADAAKEDAALLGEARNRFYDGMPLYVNFTSGSTGTPKGVAVSHRSVIDFITVFTGTFGIKQNDVLANQAPFDFDVSVKDIYSGMCMGAKVALIPREYFSNPAVLMDYLCDNKVTVLVWAVSAMCFVSVMNALDYKTPDSLRMVMFSGEVMPVKQLAKWRKFLPDVCYVNLYGPTEITCNCTYHILGRDECDEVIPIGIPFENEKVFLLDDGDNEVKEADVPGEICVCGSCLALGYFKDPERTAAAFMKNPLNTLFDEMMYRTGDLGKYDENGLLIYCGRKDFQIKHLGQRIELGDIEASACALSGVERTCCLYDEKRKKIVLFYVGTPEKEELAEGLRDKLPPFMMPGRTVKLESFALNKNGKIDRNILRDMM
ncbi:MAG: amino acid adenylation domain-containing protein [Lachnospiraceae bacterium]|nr:amino acid adenylation domain-containing protein [Lachnospiraceae bacterium]